MRTLHLSPGVIIAFAAFACVHASLASTAANAWSPIQTRSEPVPFAPEYFGQQSHYSPSKISSIISAMRTRGRESHSEGLSPPKISSVDSSHLQYYVIFSTVVDDTSLDLFEQFTSRPLLSFIGDRSFIAIGSAAWASKARMFPGVITVSPRSSESKISPEMRLSIAVNAAASAKGLSDAESSSQVRALALCYGAVGCRHALASVAHLPCSSYLHADILEIHCLQRDAAAAIAAAAESPGVYWIEPKTAISTRNWSGKSIIGTGSTQAFTAGQPNPSKVFSTVSMQNSIIGVADSGVSINNCYFCSFDGTVCSSATASTSARNIRKYWFMTSADCAKCGRCGSATAGTHPAQACGNSYDEDGHGTHVAGTIAGSVNLVSDSSPSAFRNNGVAGASAPGTAARGAQLYFQDIQNKVDDAACTAAGLSAKCGDGLSLPTDLAELLTPAYAAGARIHSDSWGCVADSTGQSCNNYESQAQAIDRFAFNNDDFLVVVAAGNDGDSSIDLTVISLCSAQLLCFDVCFCVQIGSPALCKNCLSVGASQLNQAQLSADALYNNGNLPVDPSTRSAANLAYFSSRGPTRHDGRYKPDLVAPGEAILSMSSKDSASPAQVNYCGPSTTGSTASLKFSSGTSMSTPLVAGAMEYIRQYFVQGFYPTGAAVAGDAIARVPEALLRAVVLAGSRQINGKVTTNSGAETHDLPTSYPNYAIGFGLPVIDRALFMQGYQGKLANGLQVTKPALPTFASAATAAHLYKFRCGAFSDKAVHIVLTWTDPAGNPVAMNQIVNDLDLVVVTGTPAVQRLGNNGDFPDTTNTVEKVALDACDANQDVYVAINPARVVTTQAYALAINGNVEMGSFAAAAAGAFSFDTKRFSPLAFSTSQLSGSVCTSSAEIAVIPDRSPLGPSPTLFAQTVASRLFSAALAMYMGVGLEAVSASFIDNFATVRLSITCSSYVCSSPSSMCYVSASDIATALKSRSQSLALLPLSNPLSIVNWGNATIASRPIKSVSALLSLCHVLAILAFALTL